MTTYMPHITLPPLVFNQAALSILLPLAGGFAVSTTMSRPLIQRDYTMMKQPPLSPPPYVFGPVWTGLYMLMGYAAHRAWTIGTTSLSPQTVALAKQGATLYTISLAMNYAWMPLFFWLNQPAVASVEIVALTGLTGYLIYVWGQVDEIAAWALVPYLGWLGFASYLSAGTGYLNNWDFSKPVEADTKNL